MRIVGVAAVDSKLFTRWREQRACFLYKPSLYEDSRRIVGLELELRFMYWHLGEAVHFARLFPYEYAGVCTITLTSG